MTLSFRSLATAVAMFLFGGLLGLAIAKRAPDGATPAGHPIAADGSIPSGQPPIGAPTPPPLELPAPQTVVVRSGAGGVSVAANDAPRLDILITLASSLGFDLIDRTDTNPNMTLQLTNLPVEAVLTHVLDDTPYRLRYEVGEAEAGVEIASLEVASRRAAFRPDEDFDVAADEESGEAEKPEDAEQREDEERITRMGPRRVLDAVAQREFEDARAARNERRRAEVIDELSAADADAREFAATQLDAANSEDRGYLAGLVANDPDPDVRREAAQQLGFGHGRETLAALERALADPDDGVVATALRSIGDVGDPDGSSLVEPFLNHADPVLRENAEVATAQLSEPR